MKNGTIPFTSPPKPVCRQCSKPISIDPPFLGSEAKGGGYICYTCVIRNYCLAVDASKAARDDRQNKLICTLAACVGIIIFGYGGYRHLTDPPGQPSQPTTEEQIKAERLATIDTAMAALQNERDEIDPPQDDDRDEHNYW
jgi:hypothetical protein